MAFRRWVWIGGLLMVPALFVVWYWQAEPEFALAPTVVIPAERDVLSPAAHTALLERVRRRHDAWQELVLRRQIEEPAALAALSRQLEDALYGEDPDGRQKNTRQNQQWWRQAEEALTRVLSEAAAYDIQHQRVALSMGNDGLDVEPQMAQVAQAEALAAQGEFARAVALLQALAGEQQ